MFGRNKQGVSMQLRYAILYVPDVPATMDFYARAFGLEARFLHEGGDYGEMDTGDTRLAFSAIGLMESMGKQVATSAPNRPAFEIAFTTDDVPSSLHAALSAGAVLVQEATVMPRGADAVLRPRARGHADRDLHADALGLPPAAGRNRLLAVSAAQVQQGTDLQRRAVRPAGPSRAARPRRNPSGRCVSPSARP